MVKNIVQKHQKFGKRNSGLSMKTRQEDKEQH